MRFKGLDLNLLVALDTLIEERSVSSAARRLFLSQSATSGALARLREHFSDELLIPVGRRMVLTPFAEDLSGPLRALMLQIDATVSPGQTFNPETTRRHFRIGCSDYVTEVVMSRLIPALAQAAPGLVVDLNPPSGNIGATLETGDVDILITPDGYIASAHPVVQLYEETYKVAAWNGNTLLQDGVMSVERFQSLGHVVVRFARVRANSHAETWLDENIPERRIELIAPAFMNVPRLLIGTERISIIHTRLAQMYAATLPIRLFDPPFKIPVLNEVLQYHRARKADGGLLWLVDRIQQTVATL